MSSDGNSLTEIGGVILSNAEENTVRHRPKDFRERTLSLKSLERNSG